VESEQLREHVLETFEEDEERVMEEVVRTAADAAETWARDGILTAMNRFNRKVPKEVSEP
jgi:peptidyl-tRNA hydrolase